MSSSVLSTEAAAKRNGGRTALLAAVMILIMTTAIWARANKLFQNDSESLVVGMMVAQKYDIDISGHAYGLGQFYPTGMQAEGVYSKLVNSTYDVYYHGMLAIPYTLDSYDRQIGLQGWVFYALSAFVPHALSALRLGCCMAFAGVVTAICFSLNRRFGLLFAASFYFVTIHSGWIADFAPNLYWVPFTWLIPMFLGLYCVNHPNRRTLLYPLFALAVGIKSACGYEYMTAVMLGAILFPALEWLLAIGKDRASARRWFVTTLSIGISCLLGFLAAFSVHALIRGSGNWLAGVQDIIQNDAVRRTFGSAAGFDAQFASSLNASVRDVLGRYINPVSASATARTIFWLMLLSAGLLLSNCLLRRRFFLQDALLLIGGWLVGVSWLVLAKSHSYAHTYINPVVWYLGFVQIAVYVILKQSAVLFRRLLKYDMFRAVLGRLAADAFAESR